MKLTRILTVLAALGLAFAASTVSAQGVYAGAHYSDWQAEATGSPDMRTSAQRLLAGYMFNDYVGLEVHALGGSTDDLGGGVEADLDRVLAGFARINLPMYNHWANLFGLVGLAKGEVDISGDADSISESGFAFGAGFEIAIVPEVLYVSADYVEYVNETGKGGATDIQGTASSLGLRMAF